MTSPFTDSELSSYRKLFPFLLSGTVYLNHAAISPLSTLATKAIGEYLALRSDRMADPYPMILQRIRETRSRIASLLRCDPSRIAFTDNTSNGLNVLAAGYPWKTGDRVLLNDMEFPANVYPFLNLRQHGVEVDFIRCPDGILTPEMAEAAITPKTRIVSVSFVQFLNGFKADLPAIGSLCRQRGVVFCVDAIQGLGAFPLDVGECNIDFLACGGHKWLMATEGLGFLYVTDALQELIRQQYAGWTSKPNPLENLFRHELLFDPSARRYENGSLNTIGIIALDESLKLLESVGSERIARHLLSLGDQLLEQLQKWGKHTITPVRHEQRSGIIAWRDDRAERIFLHLAGRDIHVSLREGCIRVSPHFYNTHEEIDRLVATLESL